MRTPSNAIREAASNYARFGLATIPIPAGAKGPRLPGWPDKATTDPAAHDEWFLFGPANIGIVTGVKSGVFAFDVDAKSNGLLTLRDFEATHGALPVTPTQRTGGGGFHYLFRYPQGFVIKNAANLAPGIDIRGEGGVIVAAPSLHASGSVYCWLEGRAPWETPVADAPGWLLDLLKPKAARPATSSPNTKVVVDPDYKPTFKKQPTDAKTIVAGCAAIAKVYEDPAGVTEWHWKLTLGIIVRSDDGRRLAHHMSSLDPERYSEHDAEKEIDRQLADPKTVFTCGAFAKETPDACAQCPFRHIIKTPLQLGRETKPLVELQRDYIYATDGEVYYDLKRQIVKKAKDFDASFAHKLSGSPHLAFIRSKTAPKVDNFEYMPGEDGVVIRTDRDVLIGNTYFNDGIAAIEGDWGIIREHFEYLIPNDEGQLAHLMNAIANSVQRPSQKLRHAILLRGGQRTGKSTVGKIWTQLVGKSNAVTLGKDELESTFQGGVYNRQLAIFEELFIKGRDRYNDLKDFISEDEKRAQRKNVDFYLARTPLNILGLSNNALPLMIPEADDGRWYVIHSPATPRERGYYDRLNSEGLAQLGAFKHALLLRDISEFSPNTPPPMTQAKAEMILASQPPLERATRQVIADYPSPVALLSDLKPLLRVAHDVYASDTQLADALRSLGAQALGQVRLDGPRVSPWAIRDVAFWTAAEPHEVAQQLRLRHRLN